MTAAEPTTTEGQETAKGQDPFPPDPPRRRVVLVGPMGSGKSTVGRTLGEQLGLARFDTDSLFELAYGPVPDYFAIHGEPAFRQAEEEVVGELLSHHQPCVLSLGGGSVLSGLTRSRLAYGSHVVYLQVDEHEALARLDGGVGRPVLAGDPVRNWLRILHERERLYREVSTWTVETTGRSAVEVATRIGELVREAEAT